MKKITVLFCVVLMLVSLLSGCQKQNAEKTHENITPTESAPEDNNAEKNDVVNNDEPDIVAETLAEKITREIDSAYLEESYLPEYSTTAGMIELQNKYAEKWAQVADEYYNKIMSYNGIVPPSDDFYSSDDLHTFVSNLKTNWEEYYKKQCEEYAKILETIYTTGTIKGPIMAGYMMQSQKEWALELVTIYMYMYIE